MVRPQGFFGDQITRKTWPKYHPVLSLLTISPNLFQVEYFSAGGSKSKRNRSVMVRMELSKVDLMKLHKLDIHQQCFAAQIWVEWVVRGGASDPDLSAKGSVFPIVDGKPTFKPSLDWFMEQVDMRNAFTYHLVDGKTMKRGEDLVMALRLEGTFGEIFELAEFPFDQQGLSIVLNFNCRVGGPLKIDLAVAPDCKVVLSCIRVCPPTKEWSVASELRTRVHNLGEEDGDERVFPAITFTACVSRRPFFYVVNLCVPMGLFSLLSIQQLSVTNSDAFNHRATSTMTMVLTASAYKMATASQLPPVSYLTWLDQSDARARPTAAACASDVALWARPTCKHEASCSRLLTPEPELAQVHAAQPIPDRTRCRRIARTFLRRLRGP